MNRTATEGMEGAAVGHSALGNLADLKEGEVLLPDFIERRTDGLYVATTAASFAGGLQAFVERVFSVGAYFVGLDYAAFQDLLFGESDREGGMRRLATDIRPFPEERRVLYRMVKLASNRSSAEYMFEPVKIEVEQVVPLYGPPGTDGIASVIGQQTVMQSVPTQLDFDEFVAAMWEKGVRFGIDETNVRAAIASGQLLRVEIARQVPATSGRDASIVEKTEALHRDNSPRILPDGRMELRQFKNRFPQIGGGVRLLQKLPRELGRAGHDVTGGRIEPVLPKDFDIALLAGPGTHVERGADGEFIVSAREGFINIDNQSNQLSVTEKIVSREGVSMRTTGDIELSGDEFEEHGEVQERRIVEGRHMTFYADVFGKIQSRGGRVVLKANIAGGEANSPSGSIRIEGRALRSTLDAHGGEIYAEFAEGCTIIGSRVTVGHAVNCDILAETVVIGTSAGSAIAGRHVKIAQSTTRKDAETIVTLLVPDLTRIERDMNELGGRRVLAEKRLSECNDMIEQMLAETSFKRYLALAATIAKGATKLSTEHEANWRQTRAAYAPQMRKWQAMHEARMEAQMVLDDILAVQTDLTERKARAGSGVACAIEIVNGDTLVRRMAYQPDQSVVSGVQAREIAAHLREFGASDDRLFWGAEGQFVWRLDTGS